MNPKTNCCCPYDTSLSTVVVENPDNVTKQKEKSKKIVVNFEKYKRTELPPSKLFSLSAIGPCAIL